MMILRVSLGNVPREYVWTPVFFTSELHHSLVQSYRFDQGPPITYWPITGLLMLTEFVVIVLGSP